MIRLLNLNIRRQESSDGGLVIEGSANNVDTVDSYRTRFRFTDDCIAASRGHVILWNHDTDAPIGRNLEMSMRGSDLWVRDEIDAEAVTPYGRSIPDLVRKGIVNGLSIRFDNDAAVEFGRDSDVISPNRLEEHSIVTLPSNHASTMSPALRSVLRSLEQSNEGQDIARIFRIGFAAMQGRDLGNAEMLPPAEPAETPIPEAATPVVTAEVTPAADLSPAEPMPTAPPAPPAPSEVPAGDEPVGEMTLDELREALAADPELSGETPPEPEDETLSLAELQAGLVLEPETTPAS